MSATEPALEFSRPIAPALDRFERRGTVDAGTGGLSLGMETIR
jgi:hypothetical protein